MGRLAYVLILCLAMAASPAMAAEATGHWAELTTAYGTRLTVYESGPAEAEVGMLVVPDIWGLDETVREWVDRFGRWGLHVLAVDYTDGRPVTSTPMAREVYRSIDPVWIEADLEAGLKALGRNGARLVALGWGRGAVEALRFVERRDGVEAVLVYDDQETVDAVGRFQLDVPLFEVTARHGLVDPEYPPSAADLASIWDSTGRFLSDRLGVGRTNR